VPKKVVVVDYGIGNVGSVLNMIRRAGGVAIASGRPEDLMQADKILLPGVGSFDSAVKNLNQSGLFQILGDAANAGIPILGICLGMQLLSNGSEEGALPGLGLIPGRVCRFNFQDGATSLRVPHMGWNHVSVHKDHPLAKGLEDGARFYFVHSYHYECESSADKLLTTAYGINFTSGIQRGNIMGVQFHPEKSHRFGMQLIKNFIEL